MNQMPPHVPRYEERHYDFNVNYQEPRPKKSTPFESITVPILLVFLGAAGLVAATHLATNELNKINHTLDDIKVNKLGVMARDIQDVREAVTERVDTIEKRLDVRALDWWTKADHDLWCARAEAINSGIKWKCPDRGEIRARARSLNAESVNGWRTFPPTR